MNEAKVKLNIVFFTMKTDLSTQLICNKLMKGIQSIFFCTPLVILTSDFEFLKSYKLNDLCGSGS